MIIPPVSIPETKVIVASCNLNQWALDFDGNLERIASSIRKAKELRAKFRTGPELEICGYSCEDHFMELDTFIHSEQSLSAILAGDLTKGILCDIGCPLMHKGVRYNCRVFCLDGKILLIRPKMFMADDGNYRERRFFTAWKESIGIQEHTLSDTLRSATGQLSVPIGIAAIETAETTIAAELCEELWTPESPHISHFLSGVEIISNGSGSHHQLRKLDSRLSLIKSATSKSGGVYLYANHKGCDGSRLYYDGSSLICVNGDIVAQASQFSLADVEVISAVIDLASVRSYRNGTASLQEQSSGLAARIPLINARHFSLCFSSSPLFPLASFPSSDTPAPRPSLSVSQHVTPRIHSPEEECALGPACWLWDYLRRSGASGYLLPLSGGADSAAVATIVRIMCSLAVNAAIAGDKQVQSDISRLLNRAPWTADGAAALVADKSSAESSVTAEELCNVVLNTVYMGTVNSSRATKSRAESLSAVMGAYHSALTFDAVIAAVLQVFSVLSGGRTPKFVSQGGTYTEDLALQNIQARLRMVLAYMCAQLFPWVRGRSGFLLVLGSANVDESLRGYMTKYDCSSADINPIGGICKGDLKRMMLWAAEAYSLPPLRNICYATPTAELRPILEGSGDADAGGHSQTDEEEMGMSYAELGIFGFLRKVRRCGPVTMFLQLLDIWSNLTASVVATKVKRFFYFYAVNRHKLTTLTPSYHAENYGTDDNRFDLRQFLYNVKWTRQFNCIDDLVKKVGGDRAAK